MYTHTTLKAPKIILRSRQQTPAAHPSSVQLGPIYGQMMAPDHTLAVGMRTVSMDRTVRTPTRSWL